VRGQPTSRPRPRRRRLAAPIAAILLGAGASACAHEPAQDPFGQPVPDAYLDRALAGSSSACREPLRAAFERGDRPSECTADRRLVARELAKQVHREFGFVDQRAVDLRGVSLIVVRARRCSEWPLRAPGYAVLTRPEVQAAGCRFVRYTGPLEVTAFESDGTSYPGIIELEAEQGVARLSFSEADAVLRRHGFAGLDSFEELQIGRGGWAGTVNLRRLREFMAVWHFVWVVRGRGSPSLFAALHPDHPRVKDAEALAVEASLGRQERDYLAVARDEMSARRFLERYVWSPYRRSVAAMAGAPAIPEPAVEVGLDAEDDEAPPGPGPDAEPDSEPDSEPDRG
jgi:hypothetical protein